MLHGETILLNFKDFIDFFMLCTVQQCIHIRQNRILSLHAANPGHAKLIKGGKAGSGGDAQEIGRSALPRYNHGLL
jgi:hypothetical protein